MRYEDLNLSDVDELERGTYRNTTTNTTTNPSIHTLYYTCCVLVVLTVVVVPMVLLFMNIKHVNCRFLPDGYQYDSILVNINDVHSTQTPVSMNKYTIVFNNTMLYDTLYAKRGTWFWVVSDIDVNSYLFTCHTELYNVVNSVKYNDFVKIRLV